MKVQCDVCAAEAASVFCCADEAALCAACDRRVHRANKLAGKHRRFSLLSPALPSSSPGQQQQQPPPPPPLCDICQVRPVRASQTSGRCCMLDCWSAAPIATAAQARCVF